MTEQKERPNLYGVLTSEGAMLQKDPEPDWCQLLKLELFVQSVSHDMQLRNSRRQFIYSAVLTGILLIVNIILNTLSFIPCSVFLGIMIGITIIEGIDYYYQSKIRALFKEHEEDILEIIKSGKLPSVTIKEDEEE